MKKILILGSSGLVGSATKEIFNLQDNFKVLSPLRREVDLFSPLEISKFIDDNEPDWIINCAAKVGGIVANNTYRIDLMGCKIADNKHYKDHFYYVFLILSSF